MSNKSEMPLIEHLDELKIILIKVLVANFVVMLLAFLKSKSIMVAIVSLNPNLNLVFIEPSEMFLVYIRLSFIVGLVVAGPFTIYQIWTFVAEGLYDNEKKMAKIALFFSLIFFIIGALFAYFVMIPFSTRFLINMAIDEINPMISIDSFVRFVVNIMLAMGIVFNMPSMSFLLTSFGLLKPEHIREYYRHIIIVIFLISAFITPPDITSQIMVAFPMVGLLGISYLICKWIYKRDQKKG